MKFLRMFLILICLVPQMVWALDIEFFSMSPVLLGRSPGARSAAMGRTGVAIGKDGFTVLSNPATLNGIRDLSLNFSYSQKYGVPEEADFNFAHVGYRIKNLGVIGLSRYHMFWYTFYITGPNGPEILDEVDISNDLYILTLTNEVRKNLCLGFNFELARDNNAFGGTEPDYEKANAFLIDVGAIQTFDVSPSSVYDQEISLGLSVSNVLGTEMDFGHGYKETLPTTLRVGVGYEAHFTKTLGVVAQLEWRDTNGELYDQYRFGCELQVLEVFRPRFGFYRDHVGLSDEWKTETTYGLGLYVPLDQYVKINQAIAVQFDWVSLPQSFESDAFEYEDFTTYSVKVDVGF